MNYVAKHVITALVAGTELKLGAIDTHGQWRVEVENSKLRYKGSEFASYWTSLYDKEDKNISFLLDETVKGDSFVLALINAALVEQGYDYTVSAGENGEVIASNGIWEIELPMSGKKVTMDWIDSQLCLPNIVVYHNNGDSEWLIKQYKEHLKYNNLKGYCMTYRMNPQQALYGFKVAKEHLESLKA